MKRVATKLFLILSKAVLDSALAGNLMGNGTKTLGLNLATQAKLYASHCYCWHLSIYC